MSLEVLIRAGNLSAVADLIRSGANVNCLAPDGLTPLMIAAGLGQLETAELLLIAGASVLAVDPRAGASALHKAALSGSADVVGLLLDHGAFVDAQTPILGHTALMDAVIYGHEDVVRLLLTRGARTSIRNHWNETALDLARREALNAIALLIETKNATDASAIASATLVPAIKSGDVAQVEALIQAGASIDARLPMVGSPDDDYTPLGIAAREGHAEIVRLLISAGADPRRRVGLFGGTALHEASYFGHAQVIRVLTETHKLSGPQVTDLDPQGALNGMTPLHDAVWHGHENAARALVEAGARVDLRTHAGLTAGELAVLHGYHDLALLLSGVEEAQSVLSNPARPA